VTAMKAMRRARRCTASLREEARIIEAQRANESFAVLARSVLRRV